MAWPAYKDCVPIFSWPGWLSSVLMGCTKVCCLSGCPGGSVLLSVFLDRSLGPFLDVALSLLCSNNVLGSILKSWKVLGSDFSLS